MDKVVLTLSIPSFNTLMAALQELPFRVANPVVMEIQPQVEAQKNSPLKEEGAEK